jgi:WD40 repeat protein
VAKLFVSYSRKDSIAARKLIESFKSMGQEVWVDWEAIPPAVDWLEQIFRGIEEADAFIFMISPDSIISEVCKVEVGRAVLNNKRIIPIVLRDVNPGDTLEEIRKLNWTYIREGDNYDVGLSKVKTAIELDLDWLEEHRRLQVRALEWHRKKDPSLLLRGRDLRNARHMMQTYTSKDPIPTELQIKYIEFSQRTQRTQTIVVIMTAITLIVMVALTLFAVDQSNVAQQQRNIAVTNAVIAENNRVLADQNAMTSQANAHAESTQRAIASENEKKAKQQETIARAQRSAARAQIYQSKPGELYTSTLLAIDSEVRSPSAEAEEILRRNISLLPRPMAQVSQKGKINSIALNKEGDSFVTASADGTACLWAIKDGRMIFCTPADQPAINTAAFSPDGKTLITGDQSGRIQVLDAASGAVQHIYQRFRSRSGSLQLVDVQDGSPQNGQTLEEVPVLSLHFKPPNGNQVGAAYEDGEIPVFDLKTGDISSPLSTISRPNVFRFSTSGSLLAAGNQEGLVSIWNLSNGKILNPTSHRGGVLAMALGPGNRLITSGNDKKVSMVNILLGKQIFNILTQSPVRDLAFSPDGTWFVTAADDHRIRVWDAEDGSERLSMTQDGAVSRVVVSPNGQWIASTGDDRTTRVWDALTGAQVYQIPLSSSGAELAFSSDGNYLVSTDQQGKVNIWDVSMLGARKDSMQFNGMLNNIQYSSSGDRLAVAGKNGVWILNLDPATGAISRPTSSPNLPFKSSVDQLIFSPDAKYLGMSAEGKEIALYDSSNNRMLAKGAWPSLLKSIAFTPDSHQLLASDDSGKIQAWEIPAWQSIENADQKYPQAASLAASTDYLALGAKDKITILDANGDQKIPSIDAPGENTSLAFNKNGTWLASTDLSGKILLWNYQDGKFTNTASLLREQAESLAFNADGSQLAVGTAQNVYLIDTAAGSEIARIPYRDVVTGVAFSPDGKYLTTVSSNVLQRWEIAQIEKISNTDLVLTACSRLVEKFSDAQLSAFFEDPLPLCSSDMQSQ